MATVRSHDIRRNRCPGTCVARSTPRHQEWACFTRRHRPTNPGALEGISVGLLRHRSSPQSRRPQQPSRTVAAAGAGAKPIGRACLESGEGAYPSPTPKIIKAGTSPETLTDLVGTDRRHRDHGFPRFEPAGAVAGPAGLRLRGLLTPSWGRWMHTQRCRPGFQDLAGAARRPARSEATPSRTSATGRVRRWASWRMSGERWRGVWKSASGRPPRPAWRPTPTAPIEPTPDSCNRWARTDHRRRSSCPRVSGTSDLLV
jgi:hypothetical protein